MAQIPLNYFRRVSVTLDTTPTVVYNTPYNRAAIILTALAANVTGTTQTITLGVSGKNYTETGTGYYDIVKDFEVPTKDTANLALGKIILAEYDQIIVSGNAASGITLTLSILEAINTPTS